MVLFEKVKEGCLNHWLQDNTSWPIFSNAWGASSTSLAEEE